MSSKPSNPFDPSAFFRAFDQEAVQRMFDPSQFFAYMERFSPQDVDMGAIMQSNQRQFQALADANAAALSTYRDMLEKQRAILDQMMTAARDAMGKLEPMSGADAANRNTKILADAAQTAFGLMQDMAKSAAEANAAAFEAATEKAQKAAKDLGKG